MRFARWGITILAALLVAGGAGAAPGNEKRPDAERAQQIKDMQYGMFICWSFSTFSGYEWTRGQKDLSLFQATGCDTDQWARTAKEAGMQYILFLTKHHDGFCLWDTDTTEWKVTNSPLGVDVLARLRQSCDRYGIKLALYFSEGDWTWIQGEIPTDGVVPGSPRWNDPIWRTGQNAALKKAQLEELTTRYGPIEFFWMDHAQSDGGLSHADTVEWVHRFQPDCFVGFNHGEPAGRLVLRERGRPGRIGDASASVYNAKGESEYSGYLAAEFTYPILPDHQGGAQWFYSLPKHDHLVHSPEKIYRDYLGAVEYDNIFSLNVGPDYAGRIRDVDVRVMRQVGEWIRTGHKLTDPLAAKARASSEWGKGYEATRSVDGNDGSRWGAAPDARSGWLELDLGVTKTVGRIAISEAGFNRVQRYELQVDRDGSWETFERGAGIGDMDKSFAPSVKGRLFRLQILEASDTPTIRHFDLYEAEEAPQVWNLWPGAAPGEKTKLEPEADTTKSDGDLIAGRRVIRLGNVSVPTLTLYKPDPTIDTGAAVIVAPGGGHWILAMDLEGTEVAEWLNSIGVTAAVLKYRVPGQARSREKPWLAAAQDGQRAVSLLRGRAGELGIDPERIGIMGFSAGTTPVKRTAFVRERLYEPVDDYDAISFRPDFAAPIYAASGIPEGVTVPEDCPPVFMVIAHDDHDWSIGVAEMYIALKKAGASAELHIYESGGHGYGLRRTAQPVTSWQDRMADWMRNLGLLKQ